MLAAACHRGGSAGPSRPDNVLRVGASAVPHAEILARAAIVLAKQDIKLDVVVFSDYVQPNLRLADGELDANYYQTEAYLDFFEAARHLGLYSYARIHAEPFGLYAKKIKHLTDLPDGARVAIPNEISNGHRALALLARAGLIKLDPAKGLAAGVRDITENSRHLTFLEVDAAMMPRILADVDVAGINTNFALSAGMLPARDALLLETPDSPYDNILAVRAQDKGREALSHLVRALRDASVLSFVEERYRGSIQMVPATADKTP